MSEQGGMPKWCFNLMRWTSPVWYGFLIGRIILLFLVIAYYAVSETFESDEF